MTTWARAPGSSKMIPQALPFVGWLTLVATPHADPRDRRGTHAISGPLRLVKAGRVATFSFSSSQLETCNRGPRGSAYPDLG
jgi:hypothetical protein